MQHMGSGATKQNERITNLDTVRGLATLGILVMNAVNFGISDSAYQNLDSGGSNNPFDSYCWASDCYTYCFGKVIFSPSTLVAPLSSSYFVKGHPESSSVGA